MSYGYGGRQNPYDQRDPAPAPGGYGAPPRQPQGGYGEPSPYGGSRYGQGNAGGYEQNVEMAPLAQNASSMGNGDPNAILNECRDIDRGIDQIEQNLEQLRMVQQRTLDDADSSSSSAANRQLDSLSSDTMAQYRALTERVRVVKSNPDSRTPKNNPQVGRVDRRLKQAIQQYQQVESQFRKRTQDQMARQYRIVRPDASEAEVRQAVEDPSGGQVFSQALLQSDRQGRARAALSAVQDRHKALVKIEQQMTELAQLFQDMDTLVIQQEAAVVQIEQKGEEVVDNLDKGNEEIGVAVNTARKTRKKKWICLGICVAIIAIIAIIIAIYFTVINPQGGGNGGGGDSNASKRSLPQMGSLPIINTLPIQRAARALPAGDVAPSLASLTRGRIHMPQLPVQRQ
jgi:syntaxin 1B/2/3